VLCALLFGLTLARANPAAPVSFFHNLGSASARSLVEAFAGGVIFNLGNLLLVAAISVAGMAVAFPMGAGLALVIGAVLNYIVSPAGNRLLLFGGILLICAAIASNAMAYRGLSKSAKAGTKGIVLGMRLYDQTESGIVPCDQCESRTFVHSQVVRLIALDQILRFLLGSVHRIVLELDLGGMLFLDRPSNSACFRIPFNVISHFEVFCHRPIPLFHSE
jgi:hypothetical protein